MTVHSQFSPVIARVCAVSSIVLLAACGGGDASRASYQELATDFVRIGEAMRIGEFNQLEVFDAGSLPTTGAEEYTGVFSVLLTEEASGGPEQILLLGDMDMRADFANSRITGGVTDFSDNSGDVFEGSVGISNGNIDRLATGDELAFVGDLNGTVRSNDFDIDIDIDGQIGGSFLGDNYQYALGGFIGQISSGRNSLEIGLEGDVDGTGVFVLER